MRKLINSKTALKGMLKELQGQGKCYRSKTWIYRETGIAPEKGHQPIKHSSQAYMEHLPRETTLWAIRHALIKS